MSRVCDVSANDRLVWDTHTGTLLVAKESVHMEDTGEKVFTAGTVYRVQSMHPIATPTFVILLNDQGQPHQMRGEHLRQWFKRAPGLAS